MNSRHLTHHYRKFVDEPIQVIFDRPSLFEKTPNCPTGIFWRNHTYQPLEMLSTWHDYRRRGAKQKNNQSDQVAQSSLKGSWGVGRFYFIVHTQDNRIFEIYFDRIPQNSADRKGNWFLLAEIEE
jgi:hypothetical protein